MKKITVPIFIFLLSLPLTAFALTPNDPLFSEQWYLDRISAEEAWEYSTGDETINVAVLDSGVDYVHADLLDNIWVNKNEIPDNLLDDDGNGYVDDVYGYDFVLDEGNPFPVIGGSSLPASVSHGTVISGLIGAVGNNLEGVTGVNWDVSIMPLRILDLHGIGLPESASEAVYYAVANGADVINMSFAGYYSDPELLDAIKYAYNQGVIMVAAVGNEGVNINTNPVFPACHSSDTEDWVIGVASSDTVDERADFSNYGSDCIDITAPGVDMYSVNYYDPANGYHDEYLGGWSGTSLSAPLVTGAVALILSQYPDMTPADMSTLLKLSVDPIQGEDFTNMGAGRLNVVKALEFAGILTTNTIPERFTETRFIRGASSPTVYAIAPDGTRRVVIDTLTYLTYRDSFDVVETVSDAELSSYKLKGVVLPQAGRVLVKVQSDNRVYWLDDNPEDSFRPVLREITSEDIAVDIFGSDWSSYVVDVPLIYFTKFKQGLPINQSQELDTNKLIQRDSLLQN